MALRLDFASRALFTSFWGWLRFQLHLARRDTVFSLSYKAAPFYARRQDWVAIEEIFQNAEYEECLKDLIGVASPKVLDLGANIGCFARMILAHVPGASVLSVEPGTSTFEVLKRNVAASGNPGWLAEQAAVWSANEQLHFSVSQSSSSSRLSLYQRKDSLAAGVESVNGMTIDSLLAKVAWERVDLAKIDIEGAEGAIFSGATAWLSRIDRLLIELHNDRIEIEPIIQKLKTEFTFLYRLTGRKSSKPLLYGLRTDTKDETVRARAVALHH
ncbi:MAG: FkbM family methyltransferase [Oligoflexia bacterium]|nr:FkbM family methyltransferase [Oligoflexia bacterium]